MSVASLDFNILNLTELNVGNDVYSDAVGYVNKNTSITTTENSSIITTDGLYSTGLITSGGLYSTGLITGDAGLDISGNITGDTVSSVVALNSTGNCNIAGLGFFSFNGPIVVAPNGSAISTQLFPFPSSSITQVMCTIGPISVSSGGLMVSAGVIAPYSDINSTVKFLFFNPSLNPITISSVSVILYNPLGNGGVQNIV